MKRILLLPALALLLCLAAGCSKLDRSSTFYYYFNEKIYLNERKDMLFILFEDGLSDARKQEIIRSDASLRPWTYNSRMGWGDTVYDGTIGNIAVLQGSGRISQAKFNRFRDLDGVLSLSYMFEKDGHFSAVGNKFFVKLNASTQYAQLESLVKQYGCTVSPWITDGVPWEGVYIVTVPKTVTIGTIRLANIFQETKLFEFSDPDFYVFGAFDV